jgi:hypothetical protein
MKSSHGQSASVLEAIELPCFAAIRRLAMQANNSPSGLDIW